jgi:hypothetical protein
MMIEFEDRSEEDKRLIIRYLEATKSQPPPAREPKPGCFWVLIGRLYIAYLRWRYRRRL